MPDEGPDNPTAAPTGPTPKPTPTVRKPSSETKPAPDKKGKKDRPEPTTAGGKLWHNWVKPIGLVIIVVVVLRSMLIDWNDVPTGSMEPEIQVGDRILVNRLAYALQAPLSGPKIGIPFTPIQFDNPLDGIPQLQWGEPDRGDIVTFWNPVTGVRMVKRIVAVPGDTISMTGGKLTINGETATYRNVTPSPARETKYSEPGPLGRPKVTRKPLEDLEETILGQTRVVQHIKERWLTEARLLQAPNGAREIANGSTINLADAAGNSRKVPIEQFLRNNPRHRELVRFRDSVPYIDNEPVSYNTMAQALLAPYTAGPAADLLKNNGMAIDIDGGYEIDGKPASFDVFFNRLDETYRQSLKAEQAVLQPVYATMQLLHQANMTNFGPITIGEDEYLMVGDNRNNSHDGRMFGPVKRGEITGKAVAVAFSFKDNKFFTIPPVPAWSRWFKDLD